jgi:cell division protein FtsL
MKKWIIDFLKNNKMLLLLIAVTIIAIISMSIGIKTIQKRAADLAKLQVQNEMIQADRDNLAAENTKLKLEAFQIQKEKDSIIIAKSKQEAYYKAIIKKHEKEIDSLLNVPNDTIYVRLQPIYPNLDQEPLAYPFSGGQIRQIYSVALSFPRLQDEYKLQTIILNTCNTLNKEYQVSEGNYKQQIDNLNKNIAACDNQVIIKDKELKLTQKQVKRKSFWNNVYKGGIIVLGTLAVLK